MIIEGLEVVDGPADALMACLGDPERLAAVLPAGRDFGWADRDSGRFEVTLRPALALGEVPIRTTWEALVAPPGTLRHRVWGRTDEHRVDADTRVVVTTDGSRTQVAWEVELRTTGTLRSIGQRTLAAVVAHQVRLVLRDAVASLPPR